MIPAARIASAIEVLADVEQRRRPAADALKDWGLGHRFAGSKDRAAIASLVWDALRRRRSAAWIMGDDGARAALAGTLRLQRGLAPDAIDALFSGERFAPSPLTDAERDRLGNATLDDAPPAVAADVPDWILPSLERIFGHDTLAEAQALAARAPLDLRANALKATREEAVAALSHLGSEPTPLSPWGLRIPLGPDGRGPAVQAEPAFLDGLVEVQDEGSQLASLLADARPGEEVVDLCAGGGGKTLALAAALGNTGRVYATDTDIRRLAPIHARLQRAGVTGATIRSPRGREDVLSDLAGRADLVLVDAPCTGTGTWRRNPDAKWRLRPGSLSTRLAEQERVLDRAAPLVRAGGRIAYVTCSVLPDENDATVAAFLERHSGFAATPAARVLDGAGIAGLSERVRVTLRGLQLSPRLTGTDGFYVAILHRSA